MAFSSRLKAHKNLLTLETLTFIVEFLVDRNARQAALRSGIPELYASRQGAWLKKQPMVLKALENDFDERDLQKLQFEILQIQKHMDNCKIILGIPDV
jgi:phage terminase small subunit